jgi:hypothetical protein
LEDRALFRATSHCLFCGRNENQVQYGDMIAMRDEACVSWSTNRGKLAVLEGYCRRISDMVSQLARYGDRSVDLP